MGFFEPGFREMSKYFQDMWKDAEADREKWGCKRISAFYH